MLAIQRLVTLSLQEDLEDPCSLLTAQRALAVTLSYVICAVVADIHVSARNENPTLLVCKAHATLISVILSRLAAPTVVGATVKLAGAPLPFAPRTVRRRAASLQQAQGGAVSQPLSHAASSHHACLPLGRLANLLL